MESTNVCACLPTYHERVPCLPTYQENANEDQLMPPFFFPVIYDIIFLSILLYSPVILLYYGLILNVLFTRYHLLFNIFSNSVYPIYCASCNVIVLKVRYLLLSRHPPLEGRGEPVKRPVCLC